MIEIYPHPIEGIPIIEPEHEPFTGEILLGYRILYGNDNNKLFTKPSPKRLNTLGWVSIIASLLIFWPVSCIPCFLSCSYSTCQQPVYGYPNFYRIENQASNILEKISSVNNKEKEE